MPIYVPARLTTLNNHICSMVECSIPGKIYAKPSFDDKCNTYFEYNAPAYFVEAEIEKQEPQYELVQNLFHKEGFEISPFFFADHTMITEATKKLCVKHDRFVEEPGYTEYLYAIIDSINEKWSTPTGLKKQEELIKANKFLAHVAAGELVFDFDHNLNNNQILKAQAIYRNLLKSVSNYKIFLSSIEDEGLKQDFDELFTDLIRKCLKYL